MNSKLDLRAVEAQFVQGNYGNADALLAHCRALRAALAKTATYNRVMTQDIDEARAVLAQATDQQEAK